MRCFCGDPECWSCGEVQMQQPICQLTLRTVNTALAAAGYAERLFPAEDYFYFAEGEACNWPETVVLVPRLNDLTLTEWMQEHRLLRQGARQHHGLCR